MTMTGCKREALAELGRSRAIENNVALPGHFFSTPARRLCLWFVAKSKHHSSIVGNEMALAIMNLAMRGIEADFGPENADTFRRDLSIAFQSPTRFLKAA